MLVPFVSGHIIKQIWTDPSSKSGYMDLGVCVCICLCVSVCVFVSVCQCLCVYWYDQTLLRHILNWKNNTEIVLFRVLNSISCLIAGDCWFVAAAATLATRPELFSKTVPSNQDFGEGYAGRHWCTVKPASNKHFRRRKRYYTSHNISTFEFSISI